MTFDEALDWYVQSRFSAEDTTRATGISEAAQRDLQKRKIFSPVPQKHTAKRMLFSDTVMRLAIAGAVNQCGIPLVPASKIIYADMFMEDFLMGVVDPFQMFFDGFDQEKGSYIRRQGEADPDGLYDPAKPVAPHDSDYFIEIINSRFVFTRASYEDSRILGELSHDKSDFVVWQGYTYDHIISGEKLRPTLIDDAGLRTISSKKPTSADKDAAEFSWNNPISKISVNAGMALRSALRRLLYIDPVAED